MKEIEQFLTATVLAMLRLSGVFAFAPFFSSAAFPARSKVVLALAISILVGPQLSGLYQRHSLDFGSILGEVAVGIVFGLTLSILSEFLIFAGQIAGLQLSFSLVNIMDPSSSVQTPLLSEVFQLMGPMVAFAAGLDRSLLKAVARSYQTVPLGSYGLSVSTSAAIVHAAGGLFLAAVELTAPMLAVTLLIEVSIALIGRLSSQLPVTALTIPLKTLGGSCLLIAALSLWPRFIEARFDELLNLAQRLIEFDSLKATYGR